MNTRLWGLRLLTVAGGIAVLGLSVAARTTDERVRDDRPSTGQIAFAQQVSDLMVNELVAALFTEFDGRRRRTSSTVSRRFR